MQWLIPTQQFFVLFNQNPRAEYIAFLRREAGELDLPLDGTAAGLGFTGCVVWDGLDMPAGLKHLMVIKCERCFLCLDTRNPQPFSRPWALSLTWAFHPDEKAHFYCFPTELSPIMPHTPPHLYIQIFNGAQASIFCLRAIAFETSSSSQPPKVDFFSSLEMGDCFSPKYKIFFSFYSNYSFQW